MLFPHHEACLPANHNNQGDNSVVCISYLNFTCLQELKHGKLTSLRDTLTKIKMLCCSVVLQKFNTIKMEDLKGI